MWKYLIAQLGEDVCVGIGMTNGIGTFCLILAKHMLKKV